MNQPTIRIFKATGPQTYVVYMDGSFLGQVRKFAGLWEGSRGTQCIVGTSRAEVVRKMASVR